MTKHTFDGEAEEGALRPETVVINLGRPAAVADGPLNVPITPASALQAGGVAGYARDGHAPWAALEEVIGALEGGPSAGLLVRDGSGDSGDRPVSG